MMMNYFGVDLLCSKKNDTRGCHVKFSFSETLCRYHLDVEVETDSDDAQVVYKKRIYVEMSIFADKSCHLS